MLFPYVSSHPGFILVQKELVRHEPKKKENDKSVQLATIVTNSSKNYKRYPLKKKEKTKNKKVDDNRKYVELKQMQNRV